MLIAHARRRHRVRRRRERLLDGDYGTWTSTRAATRSPGTSIDDRKMYKPGEEVTLKGWLRIVDPSKGGDVSGARRRGHEARLHGHRCARQRDREGHGDGRRGRRLRYEVHAAEDAEPRLRERPVRRRRARSSATFAHNFQIQEFRRPEFEVSAQPSPGPFLVGGGGDVTVVGEVLLGRPAARRAVNWS